MSSVDSRPVTKQTSHCKVTSVKYPAFRPPPEHPRGQISGLLNKPGTRGGTTGVWRGAGFSWMAGSLTSPHPKHKGRQAEDAGVC